MVGIAVATIPDRSDENGALISQTQGFAIPYDRLIQKRLAQLASGMPPSELRLGIKLEFEPWGRVQTHKDLGLLRIAEINPDSPASSALEVGDVILAINGTLVSYPRKYLDVMEEFSDENEIEITILRKHGVSDTTELIRVQPIRAPLSLPESREQFALSGAH